MGLLRTAYFRSVLHLEFLGDSLFLIPLLDKFLVPYCFKLNMVQLSSFLLNKQSEERNKQTVGWFVGLWRNFFKCVEIYSLNLENN